jgi:hypothetical protein
MIFQRDSNLLTRCLLHCNIVTVHEVLYPHSCSLVAIMYETLVAIMYLHVKGFWTFMTISRGAMPSADFQISLFGINSS